MFYSARLGAAQFVYVRMYYCSPQEQITMKKPGWGRAAEVQNVIKQEPVDDSFTGSSQLY